MNTAQIIHEAESLGINLWVDAGKLKYKAPQGVVAGEIKSRLKTHKPEIISFITQRVARANLHGQSLEELKQLAGDDWPECEANPEVLEAFAKTISIRKLREQGTKPNNYTQASHCQQCGPIWLWEDDKLPDSFQACVWCFNRITDVPIPRPEPISCIQCRYFEPNEHSPNAGMGGCQKKLGGHFAQASHNCNQFHLEADQS